MAYYGIPDNKWKITNVKHLSDNAERMTINGNNVRQLFAVRAEVKDLPHHYHIITFIVTVPWLDHDEDNNCSKQLGISSEKW